MFVDFETKASWLCVRAAAHKNASPLLERLCWVQQVPRTCLGRDASLHKLMHAKANFNETHVPTCSYHVRSLPPHPSPHSPSQMGENANAASVGVPSARKSFTPEAKLNSDNTNKTPKRTRRTITQKQIKSSCWLRSHTMVAHVLLPPAARDRARPDPSSVRLKAPSSEAHVRPPQRLPH